jgi:beta-mannosidase
MKNSEIETKIEKKTEGFLVSLTSKTLQKDVFLSTDEKGKFEDNFFDLLPNESKTILFLTESKTAPKLKLKTLNQFIQ